MGPRSSRICLAVACYPGVTPGPDLSFCKPGSFSRPLYIKLRMVPPDRIKLPCTPNIEKCLPLIPHIPTTVIPGGNIYTDDVCTEAWYDAVGDFVQTLFSSYFMRSTGSRSSAGSVKFRNTATSSAATAETLLPQPWRMNDTMSATCWSLRLKRYPGI